MSWYVVEGGERVGPIEEGEFQARVRDGRVRPETLVWREGFENWRPYGEIADPGSTPAVGPGRGVCAECGRTLPADRLVRFGASQVCADCKPLFFQKLREGGGPVAAVHYGGFWIRVAASILDGILLSMINGIVQLVATTAMTGIATRRPDSLAPVIGGVAAMTLLQMAVAAGYEIFFVGRFAATPGKMACGLKIVTADGGRVSYARATGRHFAELLNMFTLMIGYVIAAFDAEKRTLHDHICATRVVYR